MSAVLDPDIFEAKPRWPGAPPVCLVENRLAHASESALKTWMEKNCPGMRIKTSWLCFHCDSWHAKSVGCDPAGSSSGTGRSSK